MLNSQISAQDYNLSNEFIFNGEPYIAINPNNSQHIVTAWMGYLPFNLIVIKTKVSFDAGQTWSPTNSIAHSNSAFTSADPSIDFDDSNNVFLCYVDYSTAIDSGSVFIRKSSDGGLNWDAQVEVLNAHADEGKYPLDRPWISIDRSNGDNQGNIYVVTMNPTIFGYIPPPYNPYFIRSTDGGNSFENWKYLDTSAWLAGSIIVNPSPSPTVSSDGIFYAAYPSWVLSQNLYPQYILAASDDGGNSFNYTSIANLSNHIAVTDTVAKKSYHLLSNPVDPNHLVFVWILNDYGDGDVFMWESFDSGNSWNDPIRVNDDPIGNNKMQDLVWADFDIDGDLIITWRDRRNAPDTTYTTSSEIWGAYRHQDSTNFSPNFLISDSLTAYSPILANSGNDFMCVKFLNDTIHTVWGDARTGVLNIFYNRMDVNGTILSSQLISKEALLDVQLFPNPTRGILELKGIDQSIKYDISVYDSNGNLLIESLNPSQIDLSPYPNGTYFIKVMIPYMKTTVSKKVIKLE